MKFSFFLAIFAVNALTARAHEKKDWWQSTVVRALSGTCLAFILFSKFLFSFTKFIRARFKTRTAMESGILKVNKLTANICGLS